MSAACPVDLAYNVPVFGQDAFRTGTGVHAAAMAHALCRACAVCVASASAPVAETV